MTRAWWSTLALILACTSPADPPTPAPALRQGEEAPHRQDASPAPASSAPASSAPASPAPASPAPAGAQPEPPVSTATPGPVAVTALADGALVVWSRHDFEAERSELLVLLLDELGQPREEPRLLRRTSGEVLDLAVSRKEGQAWVAWVALLGSEPRPRGLLAAMMVAPDLSMALPPITLGQFSTPNFLNWPGRDMVRVLALAGDEAVVAGVGADARCTDIVDGRDTKCPGFELHWLRPDGTSTRAAHFGADGGDPGVGSLIDVGTGALLDVWAWHGGPTFASSYAPYGRESTPAPFRLITCRPPFSRAWTGAELVTLCASDYLAEGERCPLLDAAEPDLCPRIHAVRTGDVVVTRTRGASDKRPALTSERVFCRGGRPVKEVAWAGGKLLLDPQRAGASLDEGLGAWTGSRALRLGEAEALERWKCEGDALVADAAGPTRLPLDFSSKRLKAVPTRERR